MATFHRVEMGESLSSIAKRFGFPNWRTIYDAKENEEFRRIRPNPHLIQVGDAIAIPEKVQKTHPISVGGQHRFNLARQAPLPAELSITFIDEAHQNEPVSGLTVEVSQGEATLPSVVSDTSGTIALREPAIKQGTLRVVTIRDKRVTPEISYDRFIVPGLVFSTGQSHSLPLRVLRLPVPLARSQRRPGLTAAGTTAPDMSHGDFTLERILAIGTWGWDARETALRASNPQALFADLRDLMDDFSSGALEGVALRMADHFQSNTGSEFVDPALAQAVRAHASTGRFEANIRRELTRILSQRSGDPTLIARNEMELAGQPHFDEVFDNFNGLGITVHDTWAYDVDLTRFVLDGSNYRGVFRVTLYDHFGLDQADLEPAPNAAVPALSKPWVRMEGFRAWFLLQHLPELNFRPFITRIELDYEFQGEI